MAGIGSLVSLAGGPLSLATGALGLVNSIPSFFAAAKQKRMARNLKLQDTTPEAFKEALAMSRQSATSQMPGMGMLQNRLAQAQATGANALLRGGASSAALLGGLAAGEAQRQAAEQQLGVQGEQYRQGMQGQLRRDLATQADYKMNDLNNYRRDKAALIQSSNENLSRGLGALTGGIATGINLARTQQPDPAVDDTTVNRYAPSATLNMPSYGALPKQLPYSNGYTPAQVGRLGGLTGFRTRRNNGF